MKVTEIPMSMKAFEMMQHPFAWKAEKVLKTYYLLLITYYLLLITYYLLLITYYFIPTQKFENETALLTLPYP